MDHRYKQKVGSGTLYSFSEVTLTTRRNEKWIFSDLQNCPWWSFDASKLRFRASRPVDNPQRKNKCLRWASPGDQGALLQKRSPSAARSESERAAEGFCIRKSSKAAWTADSFYCGRRKLMLRGRNGRRKCGAQRNWYCLLLHSNQ